MNNRKAVWDSFNRWRPAMKKRAKLAVLVILSLTFGITLLALGGPLWAQSTVGSERGGTNRGKSASLAILPELVPLLGDITMTNEFGWATSSKSSELMLAKGGKLDAAFASQEWVIEKISADDKLPEREEIWKLNPEMQALIKSLTSYCGETAKFLIQNPFRLAQRDGKKYVVLTSMASTTQYNTLTTTSYRRAAKVLTSCLMSKMKDFYTAFEKTDWYCQPNCVNFL
jgi:hypothetical protein